MSSRLQRAAYAAFAFSALMVPGARSAAQTTAQPAANASDATSVRARFQRAQQRYRAAKSFRITFEQKLDNPITGGSSTSRGELVSQRPDLFAITFTNPTSGDRIVSDGSAIWVYLPSSVSGQVLKFPAGASRGAMLDPIGRILTAPAGQYRFADGGKSTVAGHAVRAVTLTPTSDDPLFTTASVWIDDTDGTVRRIDATDANGVTRQVTLLTQATNISIPRTAFTFTPPPKVRVVEQGAASR